jgi:hypothetical protein
MKYILLLMLAITAAVLVVIGFRRGLRTYLKFRGKRLVSCPETHQPAAVRVATGKAAFKATLGNDELRLSECSRWPEKEACGQECLAQIQEAPKACLVWTIINRWYQGQKCVYCHKPFGEIHWHDHPPALLDSERRTVEWNEIPAEKLQEVLGDTLARLLELPRGPDLSARTSRIGGGSARDPAAYEHLEVDKTTSLGDESQTRRERGSICQWIIAMS